VFPFAPVAAPGPRLVRQLADRSGLPLWLPWPLPRGWVVSAVSHAGDDAAGVQATAMLVSGPNPMGGPGDLLLVAEEPGVGLGARFAGVDGADPGPAVTGEPHARFDVGGRPVPMWWVDGAPDRAVYVGQWDSRWLWAILIPETAGVLLLEDLSLVDARDLGHEVDVLPYGAPPPWLTRGYDR
jgi:hypothetical protein